MSNKYSEAAKMVAAYRTGAARRRATSALNSPTASSAQRVSYIAGIVTVKKAPNAKPMSALGGATKVFGRSSFSIPEFKVLKRSGVK